MATLSPATKSAVRDFWDEAACGERLYLDGLSREDYALQSKRRYELEPYIVGFAGFDRSSGKRVLEVGVGLGADHQRFSEAGALLHGIDLTPRAIEHTTRRLAAFGLASQLAVGDAEHLPFGSGEFDLVYSWGVIHHSPDTPAAISEIHRVLKPGGTAKVMIYHRWSMVGLMLWVRYALLAGRPWRSLTSVYSQHLESPGTKAYSRHEARQMFGRFKTVHIETVLSHGDLLSSDAGQRHRGSALSIARKIWPRPLIRTVLPHCGLFMLITAQK
jgi:ubiquinone/menaquinone biosynthesis C-methylase UbiE